MPQTLRIATFNLESLLAGTPYEGFHRAASSRVSGCVSDPEESAERGADAVHNLVILSRAPIQTVEELRHHLVDPPSYRPRTARPPLAGPRAVEWDRPARRWRRAPWCRSSVPCPNPSASP